MNKFKKLLLALAVIGVGASCEQDDYTGHSGLTPTNPTITVTAPATVSAMEAGNTYEFTVTLSEPQIVDVAVYVTKIDGTATEGVDFVINNSGGRLIIPAYRTSGKVSITVNADVEAEDEETFTVQIGDDRTANATITPVNVEFTITNVTEDDLALTLEWGAELYDAEGELLDGDDIADLILYITDENDNVIETIDGSTYEEYLLLGGAPDGTYKVKAGLFSVIDVGELGEVPNLDLSLTFSQTGKIDETTFESLDEFEPKKSPCKEGYYVLATIEKTGTNYVVTEVGDYISPPLSEGTYTSTLSPDAAAYWFGIASPQTNAVEVTRLSPNTYSIADVTSGAYEACCGSSKNQAVVIYLSPCYEVTIISENGDDVTGQGKIAGTYDPATNTFTVHWKDRYGSINDNDPGADLYSTFVKN